VYKLLQRNYLKYQKIQNNNKYIGIDSLYMAVCPVVQRRQVRQWMTEYVTRQIGIMSL